MKQTFDFHVHTMASDGTLSPRGLIEKAHRENITMVAITDHDTIGGVDEAVRAGREYGVTVIPGVELSIDFSPGTMHLCGYFIDIKNVELLKGLRFVQDGRRKRNEEIVKKLNNFGIEITIQEVLKESGGDQVSRNHFAQVLINKGYAADREEAFEKFLKKGELFYMDRERLARKDAIRIISGAGGLTVLAHPAQLKLDNESAYRTIFKELKDGGVMAIEAYSSHHAEEENLMFRRLAEELGMLVTGGSDFHGHVKPDVILGVFGENINIEIVTLVEKMREIQYHFSPKNF